MPPIYSAIKVKGKKLYEYARKGESVEIKPRKVNIKKLKVLNYDMDERVLELYIECSKGTYIRSIANDLGENLKIYGHLIKLIRVKAGSFEIKDAVNLENMQTKDDVEKNLINPLKKLDYETYELNSEEKSKVLHGMPIIPEKNLSGTVILTSAGSIAAVGTADNNLVKCLKVFI